MWAKALFLSALIATGVAASPAAAGPRAHVTAAPQMLVQVQDRRGGRNRGGERNDDRQQQEVRPLREIVAMIRARYGGEMVGSQLVGGGRPTYLIRWRMPNDEYRDFQVDAVSGQIR
jgi:uncharacterized membrane protein YkoI